MTSTHIRVSRRTWKQLNKRKEPGDDFDDVVTRLTNNHVTEPGIYHINSTGETVALATESGAGDRKLLGELLDEYGVNGGSNE